MGLFENAVNTARSAAKTVGKKAEEVLDLSRNKLSISELENKLEASYASLGMLYYNYLENGTTDPEKEQALVREIDGINAAVRELKENINEMRNRVTCPACAAANDPQAVFCSQCGARLQGEE
ncbi:MAG: zinc ribbon domain-containing protein [Clostridiales bacterium]|nr:zinc ribbon domain-containing protein [Clostridiales bacterium]